MVDTVTVTANIVDVTGVPVNSSWTFTSVLRATGDGVIVATKNVTVRPVDGVLVVQLEPGPCTVTFSGQTVAFTVPTVDADLWPLIQAGIALPPDTSADALAAAVQAYLVAHPPDAVDPVTLASFIAAYFDSHPVTVTASQVTDSTTIGRQILRAVDTAEARSVIGAGTSDLQLGAGPGAAMPGDWRPAVADISDASVTADEVNTLAGVTGPIQAQLDSKQPALGFTPQDAAQRNAAGGYAGLDAGGKIPLSALPAAVMEYKGTWDAATNTPPLADGAGTAGWQYRVTSAASVNLGSGVIVFNPGDWVIYDGAVWQAVDTSDAVTSVAGRTGAVELTAADVGLEQVDDTADVDKPVSTAVATALAGKVNTSRTVTGGSGLTGGGALSSNVTLDVDFGTSAGTVCDGADQRLRDTRTPTPGSVVDASVSDTAAIALSKLAPGNAIGSVNGTPQTLTLWLGTTDQYAAITTKDPNTVYCYTDN